MGDFILVKLQLSHRIPLIRRTSAASVSCETRAVSENRSPSTVHLVNFSGLLVPLSSAADQQDKDCITLVSNCLHLKRTFCPQGSHSQVERETFKTVLSFVSQVDVSSNSCV